MLLFYPVILIYEIQTAKKSTKAEIIFAAAKEHGGSVSDLSFTKLCPEIQEFVPGELNISTFITRYPCCCFIQ
jgi:hypothetical protein